LTQTLNHSIIILQTICDKLWNKANDYGPGEEIFSNRLIIINLTGIDFIE